MGYYEDADGALQRDRRKADRRHAPRGQQGDAERRGSARRAADRDFIEREHHSMIEEALTEFAEEHKIF
jgi:hypothetical protein